MTDYILIGEGLIPIIGQVLDEFDFEYDFKIVFTGYITPYGI